MPQRVSGGPATLVLGSPSLDWLDGYSEALARGWSPNNLRDVSAEQLVEIARDRDAFLASQTEQDGWVEHPGGRVPKLPNRVRWLWDGAFCGAINLRWQPGTTDLPSYCSGHIGYAVVPWKRRRGYATAALRQILQIARSEVGLPFVEVTADVDNAPSRAVVERVGGVLRGERTGAFDGDVCKAVYRIDLASATRPETLDKPCPT